MKSAPRALSCTSCGGPAAYGAPTCRWCGSALQWSGIPELLRGEPLVQLDLRVEPLPGPVSTPQSSSCDGGVQISLDAKQMCSGAFDEALTSCSVSLAGACLDRSGGFGVLARRASAGSISCAYALTLRPGYRTWTLAALLWGTDGRTEVKVLRPPTFAEQIGGLGEWSTAELRVADSLLEVRVNGEVIETLVDGVFGFGRPGWRVLAHGAPAEIQLHAFSVHALA